MNQPTNSFSRKGIAAVIMASALISSGNAYAAAIQSRTETQSAAVKPTSITDVKWINPTTAEVILGDGNRMTIDFYGDNIFRVFRDDNGGILRNPTATPPADILVKNPRKPVTSTSMESTPTTVTLSTPRIAVNIDKATAMLNVKDLATGKTVMEQTSPVTFDGNRTSLSLKERLDEYFYGGGVQNGRFSHKGKAIAIENQNSWTDGGVASPTPFYWSTNGYGIMFHTFRPGRYDFGAAEPGTVELQHDDNYLDAFIMVDEEPALLLNDFYQLTGNPVLIPKFGFYEGHLNAYNRDYWVEDEKGILFEDGKRYKESQRDNGGVKESLNGEKNNYQFSARAVVDRYAANDMPLGWVLPNDGYGAGYGQAETLDGNIQNLKSFGDYARSKGVEIGLWTQSDLHPKDSISALLQRDIVKEVRDAGVRVLKTDVAWVGYGYSFGLNGVSDVGVIMPYYGNDARPFIISLDGWAGTQRYAGIWTGDQTGGEWEYIRFHVPTYIGSGLAGNPNISSDMDGIFGGRNAAVNIRDFQWKTFSPMQLNMDGWGSNEKYPQALGEPATSINRTYLKMKSELLPYTYTYAREAVEGKPLIRAMFLEYPNAYTHGTATKYQYLYGPDFLVAPIYQATNADADGNDIRNGIYLPEGTWIDYFNGDSYEGNRVINNFETPIWKLPVFVKAGAIIPMSNPNNNVSEIDHSIRIYELYPAGHSTMTQYDDDGTTEKYKNPGYGTYTQITSDVDNKGNLTVSIAPTTGTFDGFEPMKSTELVINATSKPKSVKASIGKQKVRLTEAQSLEELKNGVNIYYYNEAPQLNRFATPGTPAAKISIVKNPQLVVKLGPTNASVNSVTINVQGYAFEPANPLLSKSGSLTAPEVEIADENIEAYRITPSWKPVANADYYEIEFNGMLYSTIKGNELLFDELTAETPYTFKVRAVNSDGTSDWTSVKTVTKSNPLEWAIQGIKGESTALSQGGAGVQRLFDFVETDDIWHTKYQVEAVPFDLIMDLGSINQLDKMHYMPRMNAGNGTLMKGSIWYSLDKENWTKAGDFNWERNSDTKEVTFADKPTARYIKMSVSEAIGKYGSGREIYVFKVPGTESYLPGDINNDGKIDGNDLMSYTNYTGLRKGDSDFEGYISNGDINRNGLIDSYDISVVATQLEEGAQPSEGEAPVAGTITMDVPTKTFAAGDIAEIMVKGNGLQSVNALSFALPYDQSQWEFVTVEPLSVHTMENLTYDRRHTNGSKALYPTFVNIGNKATINGDTELFVLKFKAKHRGAFKGQMQDAMLIDKRLNTLKN